MKNCAPIHICAKRNCDALFGLFGAPGCCFTPMHQTFARLELPKETCLVHVKNLPWSEITHSVAYFCLCISHHIIRDICCLAIDTNVTYSMPRPEVFHPMHRKRETLWNKTGVFLCKLLRLFYKQVMGYYKVVGSPCYETRL